MEFPWLIVTTSPPSTQRKRKMAEITSDDGKSTHTAPAVFPDPPAEPIEDSAAASTTTAKEKTIEEKSSAEVQMAVDTLLKEYEDECPKRKKRQRKIKKYWDKKEKLLEKKHAQPTPSVAAEFEAALKKATEQCAELKELHSSIGRSMDQLAPECAGYVNLSAHVERERSR